MNDIYTYMIGKREEMYRTGSKTVEIDQVRFFQLFRVVCEMQHIRNIVYDEQDMAEMLKRIKAGRTNE